MNSCVKYHAASNEILQVTLFKGTYSSQNAVTSEVFLVYFKWSDESSIFICLWSLIIDGDCEACLIV